MSILTLLKYLFGDRRAICQVASAPRALWLGAMFVLAAGLAREYDAKDLTREPWYLVVPLAASLLTSLLLYSLIFLVGRGRSADRRPFWPGYLAFLPLYWMTAPLALLYAIPVGRFLSIEASTAANLALLAIVSVWRVALMTRVVNVYFGATPLAALGIVMLFADTLALVVLFLTPLPIVNIMGGIPLTESEEMIQGAALWLGCLAVPTWFVWFIGVCSVYSVGKDWSPESANIPESSHIAPSVWCLAGATILFWSLVLPFTQPEQRLRRDVEQSLAAGHISDAIKVMSRHEAEDFPPHFDPPPWLSYPDPNPPLLDVLEVVLRDDTAAWVRALYIQKLHADLDNSWKYLHGWQTFDPNEKDRLIDVFERAHVIEKHLETFERMWTSEDDAKRKQRLGDLITAAGYIPQATETKASQAPDRERAETHE